MIVLELERISTQTLLGVRFFDPAIAKPVTEGVQVVGQLLSVDGSRRVGRARRAVRTDAGVYAFFGLHTGERAEPGDDLGEQVPLSRSVAVDVIDGASRFLPHSIDVRMPNRGAFVGEDSAQGIPLSLPPPDPGTATGVFLWSSPARPAPAGQPSIRATIVRAVAGQTRPVGFPVVEVQRPNVSGAYVPFAFGVGDAEGRVVVHFPYPPVPEPPINVGYGPLVDQVFPLRIRVRSKPAALTYLPERRVPELSSILDQPVAQVRASSAGPLSPQLNVQLRFAEPLALRTTTTDPDRPHPYLVIEPAA